MRTARLMLRVSEERLEEWREWIESVPPTTQNPIPGDRILQMARSALEVQDRRRSYKRDWHREARGSKPRRMR